MQIPGSEKVIPAFRYICVFTAVIALPHAAIADPAVDYQRGLEAYRSGDVVGSMAPLKRAADAGHAPAQALYGVVLDSAELNDEAVVYLRKAAEQSDPEGQYGLAKMYLSGEGGIRDDAEADRLIRLAAAQGHERAIISLALAYVTGRAILGTRDPNTQEVSQLLLKAAEFGDVTVMAAVAKAYREGGFGFEPNAVRADEWDARLAEIRGVDTRTGGRRK